MLDLLDLDQRETDLKELTDQFIVRFLGEADALELKQELVVRLKNGYPTTEREAAAFDERQERNLQKFAEQAGITIGRKKREGPKIGRNDPCPCGSGKKYKQCCMRKGTTAA